MSCRLQRFPVACITDVHFRSGNRIRERMLEPLIFALPQSVSTETIFRSVAPVIESPFLKMIDVEGSSAEASLMPATSESCILTSPTEPPRKGSSVISVRTPVIFWPPCSSTVTDKIADFGTDAAGTRTAVAVASAS